MKVLVPNIGSTSFKYQLLEMPDGRVLARGAIERIGRPGGECPDYPSAILRCLGELVGPGRALERLEELGAVGFKAVHALGMSGVRRVDASVVEAIEAYRFILPAHNPPYAAAMRAFFEAAPSLPLVAVFETDFFPSMPEAATAYAIPAEFRELGIRRYGFHGASHRHASERALVLCPRPGLRHISCHLGGSSSLAAILDGVAQDTSFGLSPQAGIPQNNRVGDLDPFALLYMMKTKGLGIDQTADLLGSRSGLFGLSGHSGDLRDLEEAADRGHAPSRLALDAYHYAIRKYLGAFMLGLGGLDILTFSGGIGENGPRTRAAVLAGLEGFGVRLDPERNAKARGEARISADDSGVAVWILQTNEEYIVARAASRLVETEHV
jgi:acetate kinase